MEASRFGSSSGLRHPLSLIVLVVLLLRVPFLNQAIQGDDIYYLFGAQHALVDPAHPSHARYVFQGEVVDMRGHPHPPLNSWILATLLAAFGDVYEVPFHAAYILFSLIAALSMWALARRYTDRPLAATMLFIAVPAFVVNGNSLESDIPFLAFWMAGFAGFVWGKYLWSAVALVLAAMTAYQAVLATPILLVYCWMHARKDKIAWVTALTPVITVGAYQLYERLTGGALPATVLAGYFSEYGLQQLANKVKNAAALTVHLGWMVFPLVAALAFRRLWIVGAVAVLAAFFIDANPLFWIAFATGALVLAAAVSRKPTFMQAWLLLFFAGALVLFFAGSARYLLPLAAPLAVLVATNVQPKWVWTGVAVNLALGLSLASINYQHWGAYRSFTAQYRTEVGEKRVWVNGEWGLRHYLESMGALPIQRSTQVQTGDWVVSSALSFPIPITAPLVEIGRAEVKPSLPLRLIGVGSKSAYSLAAAGFRSFDLSDVPLDVVRIHAVKERKPVLSKLPMNAPAAEEQIVSGIYQLEGPWRWMSDRAVLLLKAPETARPLSIELFIPPQGTAKNVRLLLDGTQVHAAPLIQGKQKIRTPAVQGSTVSIELDGAFSVPGDNRRLGAILTEVGFE